MQLPFATLALIATTINAANLFASKPYDQENLDRYNVLRFTGGTGPYQTGSGYGIRRDPPDTCNVTQAHFIARHGERFPTASTGEGFVKNLARIRNFKGAVTGPLSFLPEYDFPALVEDRFDSESNRGPYAGLNTMYRFGAEFRNRYDNIYQSYSKPEAIKFYAASQTRVVDSAKMFAYGFLGSLGVDEPNIVVLNETSNTEGANSLTPGFSCLNFDSSVNGYIINRFSKDYIDTAVDRFLDLSPELGVNKTEALALIGYCGYDLNVAGRSQICELFTTDELMQRSYIDDLSFYYSMGPGHNMTAAIGSTYVDAIIKLLNEDNMTLTASFTHDTDITKVISTLGIFDGDLPATYIDFNAPWKLANIVPMAARLLFEKLECEGDPESYVRIVLNDAVIPIPGLNEGPGFSTSLKEFADYIEHRLDGATYANTCELANSDVPTELTFFWDN